MIELSKTGLVTIFGFERPRPRHTFAIHSRVTRLDRYRRRRRRSSGEATATLINNNTAGNSLQGIAPISDTSVWVLCYRSLYWLCQV
jgi:hypothetical protein